MCGNTGAALGPQFVTALEGRPVTRCAAGARHSAAVTADGALFTWGEGTTGQLGYGRVTSAARPRRVEEVQGGGRPLPPVADVAAGWGHTLALARDGSVWAWGFNAKGQLGMGDTQARHHPAQVLAADGSAFHAVQVAAGRHHCAAITGMGRLYTWGASGGGRLGHSHLYAPASLALTQLDAESQFPPLSDDRPHSPAMRPRGQMPGLAGSLYAFPEGERKASSGGGAARRGVTKRTATTMTPPSLPPVLGMWSAFPKPSSLQLPAETGWQALSLQHGV
jgi:alpha-tubulin suppressor-like RCC1 family protein